MTNIFNQSDYSENSNTQNKQGEILIEKLKENEPNNISKILDIGCGDGKLTKKLSNIYPNSKIIGIDSSKNQINRCPDINNVYFKQKKFPSCEFYINNFDIIFSNAAMHWIDNQKEAYKKINSLLDQKGRVFIHQGHKGCYKELKNTAKRILEDNFDINLEDWEYQINYHDKPSFRNVIEDTDLRIDNIEVIEHELPDTIVEDYSKAGLNNFKILIDDDAKTQKFEREFIEQAQKLDLKNISCKRLYIVLSIEK